MAYILDTRDIAPEDRAEAVYAAMLYASVPCYVIHERPHDPIRSRMEVWDLGDTNIFTKRSTGVRLLRTARQARQDAAPVIALAVQEVSEGRHEQLWRVLGAQFLYLLGLLALTNTLLSWWLLARLWRGEG